MSYIPREIYGRLGTIIVNEPWFNICREAPKDQARERYRPGKKFGSTAMSRRFEYTMTVVLTIDISGIRYCEIVAKNETINATR